MHVKPMSGVAVDPSIKIFRDVSPIRKYRRELLLSQRSVGFVPTMGALHEGHMSLMRQAARENDHVFVSIYVNPTQFGVNEDLESYPKTWESDISAIQALDRELQSTPEFGRVSAIFAPTTKTMYPTLPPSSEPQGHGSFITITPLAGLLEGASRPVFFRGVATVCMKLFQIVQPDRVYFGQKDIQQSVIIRRMVQDFHVNTEVQTVPTQRESDGLAMSSRNVYLGPRRRNVATVLYQALRLAEDQYTKGMRSRGDILWPANDLIMRRAREQEELPSSQRARFEVDYISLAEPETLEELEEVEGGRGAILSGAVKMLPLETPSAGEDCGLGEGAIAVRLIDNVIIQALH